jgi:hypothetical protein
MDKLNTFGFLILAVAAIGGAVAFHFLVGAKAQEVRAEAVKGVDSQKSKLKSAARDIPNPGRIKQTEAAAVLQSISYRKCQEYLGRQPCEAFTRSFFRSPNPTNAYYGMLFKPEGAEGDEGWLRGIWRAEGYRRERARLTALFEKSGHADWTIKYDPWEAGGGLPKRKDMIIAEALHWFQYYLAEILTDSIEASFQERITQIVRHKPSWDDPTWPKTPADLVYSPANFDEANLWKMKAAQLQAALLAILVNKNEVDLATVFDTYLKGEKEENETTGEITYRDAYDWKFLTKETVSARQTQFMEKLRTIELRPEMGYSSGLSYHARFAAYVRDLRTVRYRSDVFHLLSRYDPQALRDLGYKQNMQITDEDIVVMEDILSSWSEKRLAATIANIISIRDEKDYSVIRDNHKLGILQIRNMVIENKPEAGGGGEADNRSGRGARRTNRRGGGESTTASKWPADTLADTKPFSMEVLVKFERIPVFIRGFLNSSWHYDVRIVSITRGHKPGQDTGGEAPDTMRGRGAGRGATDEQPPTEPEPREGDAAAPEVKAEEKDDSSYVWLKVDCVARQYAKPFAEIKKRDEEERKKKAAEEAAAKAAEIKKAKEQEAADKKKAAEEAEKDN